MIENANLRLYACEDATLVTSLIVLQSSHEPSVYANPIGHTSAFPAIASQCAPLKFSGAWQ